MPNLILVFCLTLPLLGLAQDQAQEDESEYRPAYYSQKYLPPHVSEPWHNLFEAFEPFWELPEPGDVNAWKALDQEKQAGFIARDKHLPETLGANLHIREMNGVRVVEIVPREVRHKRHALMYLHGGGWYSFSPESTLIDTVPMADTLGLRVFSVDYQKAPDVSIYNIIDQGVTVFRHLVQDLDYPAGNIGIYGCSAGGHLALAVPNALRNRRFDLPGAAVALSPMVDFTLTNDTWITLEGHDPVISREAYVRKILPILGIRNYRDPVLSPQYDTNLKQGMPPTLIQTGGKEVLLSDSFVAYQALESAGQTAKLDVYDGMPHCFPFIIPDAPESKAALAKQIQWFRRHLALE